MEQEQMKLLAKLQYFFDFLTKKKDELTLAYVESKDDSIFRLNHEIDDILCEYKKTFEKNIYEETQL